MISFHCGSKNQKIFIIPIKVLKFVRSELGGGPSFLLLKYLPNNHVDACRSIFARAKNCLKSTVLCVLRPCSSERARSLGEHIAPSSASSKTSSSWRLLRLFLFVLLGLHFSSEDVGDMFLRNLALSQLYGVTTQKTILYVIKAVKTSNSTQINGLFQSL
jgi:hypothetical protein